MILVHEKDFPFNLRTSKELKIPERKPRPNTTRRPARPANSETANSNVK
jgi:hypothetical protein